MSSLLHRAPSRRLIGLAVGALAILITASGAAADLGTSQVDHFLPGMDLVRARQGDGVDVFIKLSQVDFYLHDTLAVPNSEWGQLDVVYDAASLPHVVFLNIVANPESSGPRWMVQNHPLTPSPNPDDCCVRSLAFFDLAAAFGAERGEILRGRPLPVEATLTDLPLEDPEPGGQAFVATVAIIPARDLINSGVPSGFEILNAPVADPVAWIGPFELELLVRDNMPNVVQESHFCGPGSAANSLHWLAAENDDITISDSLEETQAELADNMNNTNNGNWDDAQVEGKLEYIADHDLPIEVHYTGGEKLPTATDYTSPAGHGTARNDGEVTWDWLKQELDRGQDIEIVTRSHWVVLDGYLDLGESHLLRYRDDPYQRGSATTEEQEEDIATRHVWTYFDEDGNSNIGNGEEEILAAVAESPVEDDIPALPPPSDTWLITPEQPGFEFQARITPQGGDPILGSGEPACIPETWCVSGALSGRPESFVKLIGPRPNGFLWVQICRFTPSKVEIWVRQIDSGRIRYYRLDSVGPTQDDLCGLQDRTAFLP